MRRLWVIALALPALAACGGGERPVASTPLPVTDLLDNAGVEPEAGGASAVLVAHTRAKASCRVYFGRTPAADEGSATDSDMSSGPHTTHRALMVGLVPASTYYYRFAGTDAAGRSYAGPGGEFRTAAATPLPPGRNLALGAKVAAVSSEFSPQYAAGRALDGNPATEWATKGDGDRASITIDLGRSARLTGIGFRTREMSDGSAVISAIAVFVDGHRIGQFAVHPGLTVIPLHTSGRSVRIDAVRTTGGNTGAQKIAIYGY